MGLIKVIQHFQANEFLQFDHFLYTHSYIITFRECLSSKFIYRSNMHTQWAHRLLYTSGAQCSLNMYKKQHVKILLLLSNLLLSLFSCLQINIHSFLTLYYKIKPSSPQQHASAKFTRLSYKIITKTA